jgi:hypothetical protein
MFIQHNDSVSLSASQVIKHSNDFDLIIKSKHNESIKGKIFFTYLHQQFEAGIIITAKSIQIQAQYPFAGIRASAPILQNLEIDEKNIYAMVVYQRVDTKI